jgi:hypothetical protein
VTTYSIINQSTAPELTPAVLVQMAADIQAGYDSVFAPACGVLPVTILVGDTDVADRVMTIVDELDQAGALAYHTVDAKGRPVLMLGANANRSEGGVFLDVISESLSHEVFETEGNPYVNRYLDHGGAIAGKPDVADEWCDPVQGSGWRQGSTWISNFVLPAWGDVTDTDGPWDHAGMLTGPFGCAPTGYLAFRDGSQHFGAAMTDARKVQVGLFSRVAVKAA